MYPWGCRRGSVVCCHEFDRQGPTGPATNDPYSWCTCVEPRLDSQINSALVDSLNGGGGNSSSSSTNPLLDVRRFLEFRAAMLHCPPDFDAMAQRAHLLGSGTAHQVFGLAAEDAARLGAESAVVRINTFEYCEARGQRAHQKLLDALAVEAWLNVQMGDAGVGPRVHQACLQRRTPTGAGAAGSGAEAVLTLALVMERLSTSVEALLREQPSARLADDQLMEQVEWATGVAGLVLLDSKLANLLASPSPRVEGAWDVRLADFDPPLAAHMPQMRPSCRALVTLAKLGLELVCGASYVLSPGYVRRLRELEAADPQCAADIFDRSRPWSAIPPAHRQLLAWLPCCLMNSLERSGYWDCMLQGGRLRRASLLVEPTPAPLSSSAPPPPHPTQPPTPAPLRCLSGPATDAMDCSRSRTAGSRDALRDHSRGASSEDGRGDSGPGARLLTERAGGQGFGARLRDGHCVTFDVPSRADPIGEASSPSPPPPSIPPHPPSSPAPITPPPVPSRPPCRPHPRPPPPPSPSPPPPRPSESRLPPPAPSPPPPGPPPVWPALAPHLGDALDDREPRGPRPPKHEEPSPLRPPPPYPNSIRPAMPPLWPPPLPSPEAPPRPEAPAALQGRTAEVVLGAALLLVGLFTVTMSACSCAAPRQARRGVVPLRGRIQTDESKALCR